MLYLHPDKFHTKIIDASRLLKLYASKRRDFSRVNLTQASLENVDLRDILEPGPNVPRFITWSEAEIMHDAGVVDFQSHTQTHTTVFTSPTVVGFINPDSDSPRVPVEYLRDSSSGRLDELLGAPLYTLAPRMAGARRYLDDPALKHACIDYVARIYSAVFQHGYLSLR